MKNLKCTSSEWKTDVKPNVAGEENPNKLKSMYNSYRIICADGGSIPPSSTRLIILVNNVKAAESNFA